MTVKVPKIKLSLQLITAGANSAMTQSEFLAINANLLKKRENFRAQVAFGFGFASRWLKNWREILSNGDYFPRSFENCSNFIWSHWFLVQSHPASTLATRFPFLKLKWKIINYVMPTSPKPLSMVAWHLLGWYGCTHARRHGQTKDLFHNGHRI